MSAIELARKGLVDDIESLARSIGDASIDDAKTAHDRIRVAREWAKLQDDAANLAQRLVWLEACILRRIGQLDAKVLPGPRRATARHFAGLDDAELSLLLESYPGATAVTSYNLYAKAEGLRQTRQRGRRLALGITDLGARAIDDDDRTLPELADRQSAAIRVQTVRQAAAVLIDEYASLRTTSVSAVVDEFIRDEAPLSSDASPLEASAFRAGLTEAVREAFVLAPVDATDRSWEIPAFITIRDDETDQWLRVPSEFATVAQARQMLTLRQAQAERASRSATRLADILERRFAITTREGDDYLRIDSTAVERRLMKVSAEAVSSHE